MSQIAEKERLLAPLYRWFKCKLKPPKNWHLMAQQMANQWDIQKSKLGYLEHPRIHLWTDSWWNQ